MRRDDTRSQVQEGGVRAKQRRVHQLEACKQSDKRYRSVRIRYDTDATSEVRWELTNNEQRVLDGSSALEVLDKVVQVGCNTNTLSQWMVSEALCNLHMESQTHQHQT
jgi:hypothetical protein